MKKFTSFFAVTLLSLFWYSGNAFAQGDLIGKAATGFTLKNVDGEMVSLQDFQNEKGVIVIFTCNHCPYAKMYEERIKDLNKKFQLNGYPVVAINPNDPTIEPDDSFENMRKVAKSKKYTFPYLFDETQEIAKAYQATRTPHVYLLKNDNGVFTIKYIGSIDDNAQDASLVTKKYLEDAIAALEAGNAIETTTTKAIGCGIKWKTN